jgi:phosphoenolpyruvate carboxykinase (ATP)
MILKDRKQLVAAVYDSKETKNLKSGAVSVYTGLHTGRAPTAKYIVCDEETKAQIDWNNNQKMSNKEFSEFLEKAKRHEASLSEVYIQHLFAGRDEEHQLALTIRNSKIWQALFANNMFVRNRDSDTPPVEHWDLYCYPEMHDEARVLINFSSHDIIITGTHYAGEIKKSIFSVLNYVLPQKDILPMHCSVNVGIDGLNSAIFFGLSGTGKTTLSADSNRMLVGDDEHGWSSQGLFNFEGGCYAKVINLSKELEPEIWEATQGPGAVLENVVVSKEGIPMFDRKDHTENTRGSYPIERIPNSSSTGICGHPDNIIFLTCDAFGVLPPVTLLSNDEAIDHFLMGYTAKVAGTESGINEPIATFSHCFGAPFMPRPPKVYANILRRKVESHNVKCWLVNTGWAGGGPASGKRMPIQVSREIVRKILSGEMVKLNFYKHVPTGLSIPQTTNNSLLDRYIAPEAQWPDTEDYMAEASRLMKMWSNRLNELGCKDEA